MDEKQNKLLVLAIAKCFFVAFLPDSYEVIVELNNCCKKGVFNLGAVFSTKSKATKEFLSNFLPKDRNLFEEKKLQKEVIQRYENNKEMYKYGIPQVCIEVIYDAKFREKFEKRTGKDVGKEKDFYLIADFMDKVKDSWRLTNRNELVNVVRLKNKIPQLPFESRFMCDNFSLVTGRKSIGKKVKGAVSEPINNIYTAYKVFGQGEYSKILIGLKSKKAFSNLKELARVGIEEIYIRLNEKYSEDNNTKDELIWLKFALSDRDGILNANDIDVGKIQYKSQKHFYITEKQIEFIYHTLQNFKGDYIPLCLEDELKFENGNVKTLLEFLYIECSQIVSKTYKLRYDFDRYSDGLPFSKSESAFINKFFNFVASYRSGLSKNEKMIFDEETRLESGSSFELPPKFVRLFEKMNLLERLEMVSKYSEVVFPIKEWFEKSTWKSLVSQRKIDQAESLQKEHVPNKPLLSDDIKYYSETNEKNEEVSDSFAGDDSHALPADFAEEFSDYEWESSEGGFDDDPETAYDSFDLNENEPSEEEVFLYRLFCREFSGDNDFVEVMRMMMKKQLEMEIDSEPFDALFDLFEKCDRVHSYSPLWTYYKNSSNCEDRISKSMFAKQMKFVRDRFIERFKEGLSNR